MDWIEEKFDQLKDYMQNRSLVRSMIWYLCLGMLGVGAFYWITRNMCLAWLSVVAQRHEGITVSNCHPLGIWEWYGGGKEKLLLNILNFVYSYCLYIYTFLSFCIVGKLFLEKKIKPALSAVTNALNFINLGDYGHEISWHSQDEMGALCQEVELLRKNLMKNKRDQWKIQEEQRRINAAFAHDIRTPLTVIRGYTEFLQKHVPRGRVTEEMLLDKLETMHEQEERLLRFSATMTTIQNMEKWEISGKWYLISELQGRLWDIVCGMKENTGKEIMLRPLVAAETKAGGVSREESAGRSVAHRENAQELRLFLDLNLLTEVFENLLNNALRYAAQQVEICLRLEGKELTVFVKDDGPGFSERALRRGADAYFSEAENSREHFGIGLSICKILCESHGGRLTLQNSVEQGAITAASLTVGVEEAVTA